MLIGPDGRAVPMHYTPPPPPQPPKASEVSTAKQALQKQLGTHAPDDSAALAAAIKKIQQENALLSEEALARAAILLQQQYDASHHQPQNTNVDPIKEAASQVGLTHQFDTKTLDAATNSLSGSALATTPAGGSSGSSTKPTVSLGDARSAIQSGLDNGLSWQEAVNAARVQFGGESQNETVLDEAALTIKGDQLAGGSDAKSGNVLNDASQQLAALHLFGGASDKAAVAALTITPKPSKALAADAKSADSAWATLQRDQAAHASAATIQEDWQVYHSDLDTELSDAANQPNDGTSGSMAWLDDPSKSDLRWQAAQAVIGANTANGLHGAPSANELLTSLRASQIVDTAAAARGTGPSNAPDNLKAAQTLTQKLQGVPTSSALYREVMGDMRIAALHDAALADITGAHGDNPQDTLVAEGKALSGYRNTALFQSLVHDTLASGTTQHNLQAVGTPGKLGDLADLLDPVAKASPELAQALVAKLQGKIDDLIGKGPPYTEGVSETPQEMDSYYGPISRIVQDAGGPKSAAAKPLVDALRTQLQKQQAQLDRDRNQPYASPYNSFQALAYMQMPANDDPTAVYQSLINEAPNSELAKTLSQYTGLKAQAAPVTTAKNAAGTLASAQIALNAQLKNGPVNGTTLQKALAAARNANPSIGDQTWAEAVIAREAQSDAAANATSKKNAPPDLVAQASGEVTNDQLFDADTMSAATGALQSGKIADGGMEPKLSISLEPGQPDAAQYMQSLVSGGMTMPEAIALTRAWLSGAPGQSNPDLVLTQAALTVEGQQYLPTYYSEPNGTDPIDYAAQQLKKTNLIDPATIDLAVNGRPAANGLPAVTGMKQDVKPNLAALAGKNGKPGLIDKVDTAYTAWQTAQTKANKPGASASDKTAAQNALNAYHTALSSALNAAAGHAPTDSGWQSNPLYADTMWKAQNELELAALAPQIEAAQSAGKHSPQAKALETAFEQWQTGLDALQIVGQIQSARQSAAQGDPSSGDVAAAQALTSETYGLDTADPQLYQQVMGDATVTSLESAALASITSQAAVPNACTVDGNDSPDPKARLHAEGTRLQAYEGTVLYAQLIDGVAKDPATQQLFSSIASSVNGQKSDADKLKTLADTIEGTSPDLAAMLVDRMFRTGGKHPAFSPSQLVAWTKSASDLTQISRIYVAAGGAQNADMTALRKSLETMITGDQNFGKVDYESRLNTQVIANEGGAVVWGEGLDLENLKKNGVQMQLAQDMLDDAPKSALGVEIARETGFTDLGAPAAPVSTTGAGAKPLASDAGFDPSAGIALTQGHHLAGLSWQDGMQTVTSYDQLLNTIGEDSGLEVDHAPSSLDEEQALSSGQFALYDANDTMFDAKGHKTTLGQMAQSLMQGEGVSVPDGLAPVTLASLSGEWWDTRTPSQGQQGTSFTLLEGIGADGRMIDVGPADTTARSGYTDWQSHTGFDNGYMLAQPHWVTSASGVVQTGNAYFIDYKPYDHWYDWDNLKTDLEMAGMVAAGIIALITVPESAPLWMLALSEAADAYFAMTAAMGTVNSLRQLSAPGGTHQWMNWASLAANVFGGAASGLGVLARTGTIMDRVAVGSDAFVDASRVVAVPRNASALDFAGAKIDAQLAGTRAVRALANSRIAALLRSRLLADGGLLRTVNQTRALHAMQESASFRLVGLGAMGTNLVSMGGQAYQMLSSPGNASAQDWLNLLTSAGLMVSGMGLERMRAGDPEAAAAHVTAVNERLPAGVRLLDSGDVEISPEALRHLDGNDVKLIAQLTGRRAAANAIEAMTLMREQRMPDREQGNGGTGTGDTDMLSADQAKSVDDRLPADLQTNAGTPDVLPNRAQDGDAAATVDDAAPAAGVRTETPLAAELDSVEPEGDGEPNAGVPAGVGDVQAGLLAERAAEAGLPKDGIDVVGRMPAERQPVAAEAGAVVDDRSPGRNANAAPNPVPLPVSLDYARPDDRTIVASSADDPEVRVRVVLTHPLQEGSAAAREAERIDVPAIYRGDLAPGSGSALLARILQDHGVVPRQLVFRFVEHESTLLALVQDGDPASTVLARSGARALSYLGLRAEGFRTERARGGGIDLVIDVRSAGDERELRGGNRGSQPAQATQEIAPDESGPSTGAARVTRFMPPGTMDGRAQAGEDGDASSAAAQAGTGQAAHDAGSNGRQRAREQQQALEEAGGKTAQPGQKVMRAGSDPQQSRGTRHGNAQQQPAQDEAGQTPSNAPTQAKAEASRRADASGNASDGARAGAQAPVDEVPHAASKPETARKAALAAARGNVKNVIRAVKARFGRTADTTANDPGLQITRYDVNNAIRVIEARHGELILPDRKLDPGQVALLDPERFDAVRKQAEQQGLGVLGDNVLGFTIVNGTMEIDGRDVRVVLPASIAPENATASSLLMHDMLHFAQSPAFVRWAHELDERLNADAQVRANGWFGIDTHEGLTELFNVKIAGGASAPDSEDASFGQHVYESYRQGYNAIFYPLDGAVNETVVARIGEETAARAYFRADPEALDAYEAAMFDVYRNTPSSLLDLRDFVERHTEPERVSDEVAGFDTRSAMQPAGDATKDEPPGHDSDAAAAGAARTEAQRLLNKVRSASRSAVTLAAARSSRWRSDPDRTAQGNASLDAALDQVLASDARSLDDIDAAIRGSAGPLPPALRRSDARVGDPDAYLADLAQLADSRRAQGGESVRVDTGVPLDAAAVSAAGAGAARYRFLRERTLRPTPESVTDRIIVGVKPRFVPEVARYLVETFVDDPQGWRGIEGVELLGPDAAHAEHGNLILSVAGDGARETVLAALQHYHSSHRGQFVEGSAPALADTRLTGVSVRERATGAMTRRVNASLADAPADPAPVPRKIFGVSLGRFDRLAVRRVRQRSQMLARRAAGASPARVSPGENKALADTLGITSPVAADQLHALAILFARADTDADHAAADQAGEAGRFDERAALLAHTRERLASFGFDHDNPVRVRPHNPAVLYGARNGERQTVDPDMVALQPEAKPDLQPQQAVWRNAQSPLAASGADHVVLGHQTLWAALPMYEYGMLREPEDTWVYALRVRDRDAGRPLRVGRDSVLAQGVIRAGTNRIEWLSGHPQGVTDAASRDGLLGNAPRGHQHAVVLTRGTPQQLDAGETFDATHWYANVWDLPLPDGAKWSDRAHGRSDLADGNVRAGALLLPRLIGNRYADADKSDRGYFPGKNVMVNLGRAVVPLLDPANGRTDWLDMHNHFTTFAKPASAGAGAFFERMGLGPQMPDLGDELQPVFTLMSLPYSTRANAGNWLPYTGLNVAEIASSRHGDFRLFQDYLQLTPEQQRRFVPCIVGVENMALKDVHVDGYRITPERHLAKLALAYPEIDRVVIGEVNLDSKEIMTALRGRPLRQQLHPVSYGEMGMPVDLVTRARAEVIEAARQSGLHLVVHADKGLIQHGRDSLPIRGREAGQNFHKLMLSFMLGGPYDLSGYQQAFDDPTFVMTDDIVNDIVRNAPRQNPASIQHAHMFGLGNWSDLSLNHLTDIDWVLRNPLLAHVLGDDSWFPVKQGTHIDPQLRETVIRLLQAHRIMYGGDQVNSQSLIQATAPWGYQQSLLRDLDANDPLTLNRYAGGIARDVIDRSVPGWAWFRYRSAKSDDPYLQSWRDGLWPDRKQALDDWVAAYERAHPGVRPDGPPPADVWTGDDVAGRARDAAVSPAPPTVGMRESIRLLAPALLDGSATDDEIADAFDHSKLAAMIDCEHGVPQTRTPDPAATAAGPGNADSYLNRVYTRNAEALRDSREAAAQMLDGRPFSKAELDALQQWREAHGLTPLSDRAIEEAHNIAKAGGHTLAYQLLRIADIDRVDRVQAANGDAVHRTSTRRNIAVIAGLAAGAAAIAGLGVVALQYSFILPVATAGALIARAVSMDLKVASTQLNRKITEVVHEQGLVGRWSRGLMTLQQKRLDRSIPGAGLDPARALQAKAVIGEIKASALITHLMPVNVENGEDAGGRQATMMGEISSLSPRTDQATGVSSGTVESTNFSTRTGAALSLATAAAYSVSVVNTIHGGIFSLSTLYAPFFLAGNTLFSVYQLIGGVSGLARKNFTELTPVRRTMNRFGWPFISSGNALLGGTSVVLGATASTLGMGLAEGAMATAAFGLSYTTARIASVARRAEKVGETAEKDGAVEAPRYIPKHIVGASVGLVGLAIAQLILAQQKKDAKPRVNLPETGSTGTSRSSRSGSAPAGTPSTSSASAVPSPKGSSSSPSSARPSPAHPSASPSPDGSTGKSVGTSGGATRRSSNAGAGNGSPQTYTVQPADSLWTISDRHLSEILSAGRLDSEAPQGHNAEVETALQQLLQLNPEFDANPDLIFPDQTLELNAGRRR